ncbi:LysR family transcriptional regulator [Burkholderia pseudomultivorans]|uniref:HTH-type transcriptional regulator DmlR n=1 Tax=Burkholderia pseudomultivorans TaxID=1207504 RepID=A0ABU2DXL0_9BURK|nr:LysR family transcriptional regulator [Burkholderia pseudomultivorans]MDR8726363.1 HTH-type transcriptional regulator DmlR [Burkholderia pseudomultivorans]MDR8733587.1 HTH-type transcriptional regulator DmlR [Burkholderia pseudomultivorans]MDR8740113.1 HTH-type transcriptional regulator DmlR [Burkholderia pseudomultivorans]MDR8752219.1 HTH-type transcriptional regulator DmlR [Burkholderia pseudomultivorans]MDR8776614.1 HTH-type transcriptional regulator DmlR [Burkholderia pseudomultivorans]
MDYFAAVRAFLYAADLGSFNRAADQLKVKTSTVSRHIAGLERDLGIALFNRSTRGLVLTEGGRVFREQGAAAIQMLDDARTATSSLNASPQGLRRVTMPTSFGRRHIVSHLPAFMEQYPHIDVDAVITDEVLNFVDTGIDVAVRIGVLPDSQLMARRLANHKRVVCASPSHVERYGTPSTPAELEAHPAIRFSLAGDESWLLVRRSQAGKREKEVEVKLQGRLRADHTEAILDLAIAGCGIALLPVWAIGPSLRFGTLVQLLPEWEAQATRADPAIWGLYPRKKTVSSKVRAFLDFYADLFERDGYWQT